MATNPDSLFYLQYAYDRLGRAIEILATSPESLSDRLVIAAQELGDLKSDHFPEGELRQSFDRLHSTITARDPKGDEGSLRATVTGRRKATLAGAQQFFDLYIDVCMQREHAR